MECLLLENAMTNTVISALKELIMVKKKKVISIGANLTPSSGHIYLGSQLFKAKLNLIFVLGGELFGLEDCYKEDKESSLGP